MKLMKTRTEDTTKRNNNKRENTKILCPTKKWKFLEKHIIAIHENY